MNDKPLFDDSVERSPEEIERAERLFAKLAAEEPPLDAVEDTARGRTAPRQAAITGDTRPQKMIKSGGNILLTAALGLFLLVSLLVTVAIFILSQDSDEAIADAPTQTLSPTEALIAATIPFASATPIPTVIVPTQAAIDQFVVNLPPTAAADERGSWVLTPVGPLNLGGRINRRDDAFTVAGAASRLEVIPYTVQRGDTLTGVADQFALDICSLVWSNPRNKVSPLRVGVVIDIIPVDGVLFKVEKALTIQQVAEATQVNVQDILDSPYNNLPNAKPETLLVEGMKIVVPGGVGGDCNIWQAPSAGSGSSGAGGVSGGGGGGGSLWGCGYGVESGGFAGITPVGGKYTFFQGFSAAHTGVDLSASTGTPVLSAGSGAVAFAGWNEYGYGNVVVIDHGGIYTLYAHMSAINVGCGQQVASGSVIGAVGSTGRSSGPHLHFEIRDAGFNPIDPTYSVRL